MKKLIKNIPMHYFNDFEEFIKETSLHKNNNSNGYKNWLEKK